MELAPLALGQAEGAFHFEETGALLPGMMEGPLAEDSSPRRVAAVVE
jgi:hypothetical protein